MLILITMTSDTLHQLGGDYKLIFIILVLLIVLESPQEMIYIKMKLKHQDQVRLFTKSINWIKKGKYNIPVSLKTKTGFTILGKTQAKGSTNDTPGPNVYNQAIEPLRQTAPAFR